MPEGTVTCGFQSPGKAFIFSAKMLLASMSPILSHRKHMLQKRVSALWRFPYALKFAWPVLFTCGVVFGNPIIVMDHGTYYSGTKSAESCIAILGEDTSLVSCDVRYDLSKAKTSADSYYVFVALPVFVSADEPADGGKLADMFSPRIEFEGQIIAPDIGDKPSRIRDRKEAQRYKAPEGTDVVFFRFSLEAGLNRRSIRFLVRYTQPMIHGRFLYMPLFEGRRASSKGTYQLEALASNPSWHVVNPRKPKGGVFASRQSFDLSKQKLIELELKKAADKQSAK